MNNVHFLLDESSALGEMGIINDAIDRFRKFGIRLIFFYQSIAQLQKCFPRGQDITVLANCTQIYFAISDIATAKHVSERLGSETVIVNSGGRGRGFSLQRGNYRSDGNASESRNASDNWQPAARPLLFPQEVIALPPRVAITFTPGTPPIASHLIRFYEEDRVSKWAEFRQGIKTLALSAAAFVLSVMCLVLVLSRK